MRLDIFWKKRFPKSYSFVSFGLDKKSWYNTTRYISFVLAYILYLHLASGFYGKFAKKQVEKQNTISIRFADDEIKKGKLIGKTNDIVFLLNDTHVEAIPITSLVKDIRLN
jgi:hypothetical protein